MSFQDALSDGRFLKTVELRPPKGVVVDEHVEVARRLHGRIDGVVVPDNPGAVMTLSGVALGRRIVDVGHNVILHVSCRDRNRIALQSMLLGAYAEGIRTVMVSRGTDTAYGDHARARSVYDLEPHELLAAIDGLSEGFDMSGTTVEGRPGFLPGAEINPWLEADALDEEIDLARKRVESGAKYLITTPVHDAARFAPVVTRFAALGVPIIARIILIKSVGMARYLNAHVAGFKVPDASVKRLRKAPDKAMESLAIAADLAEELKPMCRGVCFVPLGWESKLPALMDLLQKG